MSCSIVGVLHRQPSFKLSRLVEEILLAIWQSFEMPIISYKAMVKGANQQKSTFFAGRACLPSVFKNDNLIHFKLAPR